MRFLSLFSGIAGFENGIDRAYAVIPSAERQQQGRDFEGRRCADNGNVVLGTKLPRCIGYAEIDRSACAIYRYHRPSHKNYGDAAGIICGDLPDFEFLCAGFPCQSFSIAGKRLGFEDVRGTLFFEIARILRDKRPGHFLLENVKGILSHDGGKTFQTILGVLADIGYFVEVVVLNSKDYGVPQNRERVFFIGHFADRCAGEVLPIGRGDQEAIPARYERNLSGTISTKNQSGQCNFDGSTTLILGKDGKRKNKTIASTLTGGGHSGGNHSDMDLIQIGHLSTNAEMHRVYSSEGIARTQKDGGGQGAKTGLYEIENRIRRLTPTECELLQGFLPNYTEFGIDEKGNTVKMSDSARYRVLGNAVTVNVISAIIFQLLEKNCLD